LAFGVPTDIPGLRSTLATILVIDVLKITHFFGYAVGIPQAGSAVG